MMNSSHVNGRSRSLGRCRRPFAIFAFGAADLRYRAHSSASPLACLLLLALAASCAGRAGGQTPSQPLSPTPPAAAGPAARTVEVTKVVTSLPTGTPRPTSTPTRTATPLPTPFALVGATPVEGRRGPGEGFESLGLASAGQQLLVLGRTADASWLLVCCVRNQPAWVQPAALTVTNSLSGAPAVTAPPLPSPTPTLSTTVQPTVTVTPEPEPTALPPFDIAQGPEFPWPVTSGMLTIMVKVYQGPASNECALGGYTLDVIRDGVDVSKPILSRGRMCQFDTTGPAAGNYEFNLKYEYANAGQAQWAIYLARPDGTRVSRITMFNTIGSNSQQLAMVISYFLAR